MAEGNASQPGGPKGPADVPNSEILFDFNEGSSGVFKDHLNSYPARGGPSWADAIVPSRVKYITW